MKKILFLLSIALFYSCNPKSDGSNTIHTKDGFVPFASVRVFEYKNTLILNLDMRE